jgi:hypothetical protein
MSARRQNIIVFRSYQPVPEDCSQALALLLKAPAHKEAARSAAPNDGEVRSDEFPVSSIIREQS